MLQEPTGFVCVEAGAAQSAAFKEVLVPLLVVGRVAEGLGNGDAAQLRVLGEHLPRRQAVRAHLEDVLDGEARAVAERLAVHDERIDLDPLDRHAPASPAAIDTALRSTCR